MTIGQAQAGQRLDRALAEAAGGLSRTRIQALIAAGAVTPVTAHAPLCDVSYRVRVGEAFRIVPPAPADDRPLAQEIALDVVYEDAALIVVNKPAGMVVHPAPGNRDNTLVNALLAHCGDSLSGIGGVRRPGIVHRLDKDTSGLMVAAKTDAAHQGLAAQFAAHSIERAYRAVVWGVPNPRRGTVEGAIGRSPRNRQKMAVVARGGKPATTHYAVAQLLAPTPAGPAMALVDCRLDTGRTHQIRVHLTAIGHPLVGDPVYGRADRRRRAELDEAARVAVDGFARQALHARTLGFDHPVGGARMAFVREAPDDFVRLVEVLGEAG
ncbi:MAG: RluA family pseudouridine synthase [Alphaproteobacteria bacterium]